MTYHSEIYVELIVFDIQQSWNTGVVIQEFMDTNLLFEKMSATLSIWLLDDLDSQTSTSVSIESAVDLPEPAAADASLEYNFCMQRKIRAAKT